MRRSLAAAALLAALSAGPAFAQTPQEMIGAYHMTVVSKYGPCTTDPTFEVDVREIAGGKISLLLGSSPYSVDFDPNVRRFAVADEQGGGGGRATMNGQFSRTADAVVLEADATWAVGCGGHIVGSRPASQTTIVTPPAITDTTTTTTTDQPPTITVVQPPDTYTFGGASTPQPSAAACPPTGMNLWLCLSLALIMFLLGLAVGWLLFHEREEKRERKREADADRTPDKPPEESS